MRIAILSKDRCQPRRCSHECEKYCPRVRTGDETIVFEEDGKPVISEELCVGCGICVHKCPFDAIMIIGLPEALTEPTHRYGPNSFALYGLPTPQVGKVTGILGPNGIGKTTLFKIILNEVNPSDGEITLGHNVFTGYFDQEQQKLNLNNTVFDEILEVIPKASNTEIRSKLGMFLFQEDDVFKIISSLSGGEKGRLSLLKLILTNSNFILLDEPTNHLDIKSKEVLEKALINYTGTLLIISHDRYFLNQVTNKIFEFSQNNIKTYLGNYDYYIEKKRINKELFKKDIIPNQTKTEFKKELQLQKEKQKLIKKKKQRSEKIFQEIEMFEEALQSNEELLCKKEIYTNGSEVKKINIKNSNLEKTINELYEELSELEIFLENL